MILSMPRSWGFCETVGPLDPEKVKATMTRLGNYGRSMCQCKCAEGRSELPQS